VHVLNKRTGKQPHESLQNYQRHAGGASLIEIYNPREIIDNTFDSFKE